MKRFALALIAIALPSFVHGFSVSPMVSDFDPNATRSQQVFVLSNNTDDAKPVEVTVAKPIIGEDGAERLDIGNGEDSFLIIPQQLVLPPNSKRSVKVFYVGDPRENEDTYRFIFKELPIDLEHDVELAEGESSFSMRVVVQYNVRVWLTPAGFKDELAITEFEKIAHPSSAASDSDGSSVSAKSMLRFTVANSGPAHGYIRYPRISLVKKDGRRFELGKESLRKVSGKLIFPESEKEFAIDWLDEFPSIEEIAHIDMKTAR